jgi:hypothetical protein
MHWMWGAIPVAMVLVTAGCAATSTTTDPPDTPGFRVESVLPLNSHELAQATKTTKSFAAAYETWRYDESPADYLGSLSPYTTSELLSRLTKSANTQDLLVARAMVHEIATAEPKLLALRSVGKWELTFTARVNQSVTTNTKKTYTHDYAIWLIKSDVWRVTDIAPVQNAESDDLWMAG